MSRWDPDPERLPRACVIAQAHPRYRNDRDVLAVLQDDHAARWGR